MAPPVNKERNQTTPRTTFSPIIYIILITLVLFTVLNTERLLLKYIPSETTTTNTVIQQKKQHQQQHHHHPLDPPRGKIDPLPSIRITTDQESKIDRQKIYGGVGDKPHLGGFTQFDVHGISPDVWTYMLEYVGVKSLLDLGCGKGVSTLWFALQGVEVLCAEGSHDAVSKSLLPQPDSQVVEHDFSRGPWWPSNDDDTEEAKTFDAVWCVEFVEHVSRNFMENYLPVFRSAGVLFISHSHWGGWHHVEVHDNDWWRLKMESMGFVYSEVLTNMIRGVAQKEGSKGIKSPSGENFNAQHIWLTMQVFINPRVTVLPKHKHLLAQPGCFVKNEGGVRVLEHCGRSDGVVEGNRHFEKLPEEYLALEFDQKQHDVWFDMIQKSLGGGKKEEGGS